MLIDAPTAKYNFLFVRLASSTKQWALEQIIVDEPTLDDIHRDYLLTIKIPKMNLACMQISSRFVNVNCRYVIT